MTLWLALLFSTIGIAASDFFCVNLNTIANMLGMSESLAGVTLLAFGNGSPDVFSTFAAFRTHAASLAIGELIGAACFITAVVSGSMALIRPFGVARKSFIRDVAFFLVAAAFSMGFIVDGKLHLWECATMVGFYLFYVAFVVAWHWWLNLRKARRQKAALIRSHYITPGGDEEEIPEYHDEETTAGNRTPGRGMSADDISTLERAAGEDYMGEDDNEEERERWMGELTNNMRVNRPNAGSRSNTHNPIRPSLVGALEFRAVLSSLQKSRNIQSMPISLRRYSDDPNYTTAQQQDYISSSADPASRPPFDVASIASDVSPYVTRPNSEIQQHMGNRARAVSTNDIDHVRVHPSTLQVAMPSTASRSTTSHDNVTLLSPGHETLSPAMITPTTPQPGSRILSPAQPGLGHPMPDRLAPPSTMNYRAPPIDQNNATPSPFSSPVLDPGERPAPPTLRLSVPGTTSSMIPFPAYNEYPWSAQTSSRPASLRPRSPSASPESVFPRDSFELPDQVKVPHWWPSRILPTPHVLVSTLFPTLTNWRDKSIFDKFMGVVASLPVFLLTITLPVVELQRGDDEAHPAELAVEFSLPAPLTPLSGNASLVILPESSRAANATKHKKRRSTPDQRSSGGSLSTATTQTPHVYITSEDNIAQSPEELRQPPLSPPVPKDWNRWLVFVQMFTAPLFIVLIVWANLEPDEPRSLLRHVLYSLIASLCMLAFLLITTTPDRPPRWRSILCFLGFAVAIAWISTIANEVVGVLRTLGVILNMSDAILGLTIFAVGNSLGDLVADITVARLGFPIMALSACFGGPMLNILLGVGLSGLYMTITKGEHRHEKHPNEPIRFKPYHLTISTTLVISGATLLVTLAGLLVAVPMRKWRMDRFIGWGLIVLWSVSTLANVIVEVFGFASDVS